MKARFTTLLFTLLLSAKAVFAAPTSYPSTSYLSSYYDLTGNMVLCFYFDDAPCYDVYFVGTNNNWGKGNGTSEAWSNCNRFSQLPGYSGWYVVSIPYDGYGLQGKPIQSTTDGSWSWDYQCGDASAWTYHGGNQISIYGSEYSAAECEMVYSEAGAYIYELSYWKNHRSPCQAVIKHSYSIKLYAPDACPDMKPAILGDFNNWSEGIPMTEGYDASGHLVYSYNIYDQEGHGFKIREQADTDWSNQIEHYNTSTASWVRLDNYELGSSESITLNWADNTQYRFSECVGTLSVAEAIAIGQQFAGGATSSRSYQIEGYVVNAEPFSLVFGDQVWYMADNSSNSSGQEFQAYHCTAIDGSDTLKVVNGDKVLLSGYLTKFYNSSKGRYVVEVQNGVAEFISKAAGDHTVNNTVQQISVSQALEIGSALSLGATSDAAYDITGYVSAIAGLSTDFTNKGYQVFWIADSQSSTASSNADGAFEIYRGVPPKELQLGDKVRVRTAVKKYNSNGTALIESETGVTVTIFEDAQQPEEPEEPTLPEEPTPCSPLSGTCGSQGDNLTWTFSCDGVLTISGTGDMADYASVDDRPWNTFGSEIASVVIGAGVTRLGNNAFSSCAGLVMITSNAVTPPVCGDNVFSGVEKSIPLNVLSGSEQAYSIANQWSEFTSLLPVGAVNAISGLNVMASGLKAVRRGNHLVVDYRLNTDATALYFEFYDANQQLVFLVHLTDAALLTAGAHQTTIDLPLDYLVTSGTYTWAMHAYGEATVFTDVLPADDQRYRYYIPRDVVVDNSFESDYFGRIYVSSSADGQSEGYSAITQTQTRGIYIYNNDLGFANGQVAALLGYDGGLGGDRTKQDGFNRLTVDEQGYVYLASRDEQTKGIYRMNPARPSDNFATVLSASDGVNALDIVGNKLYTIENVGVYDGSFNTYSLQSIPIGAPLETQSTFEKTLANTYITIRSDHREGFWVTQQRYGLDLYSALMHWNKSGNVDFAVNSSENTDLLQNSDGWLSSRGTLGVNPAGDKLAVASNKRAVVFAIEYDANGVPSLTKICETPALGNHIDGIAFDVADNLYVVSASTEHLYVFPIAKDAESNHCRVYAPSKYAITLDDNSTCTIASGTCGANGGNLTWSLSCDSVLTISGAGAMADYDYWNPAPWNNEYHEFLKDVIVEDGVTSIGDYAFYLCGKIKSLTLSNSVESLGEMAFYYCYSLMGELKLPANLTSIGDWAFSCCYGLTGNLVIPTNVTNIGEDAFRNCDGIIGELIIPDNLQNIGIGAFRDCHGLTSINVVEGNAKYSSIDGVLFNKDKTVLLQCPAGKQGSYNIPNSVITIEKFAHEYCDGLTGKLVIPNSVTNIDDYAFMGCSGLTDELIIPNSVINIGNSAFGSCVSLTSINIPNSVTSIGEYAFVSCQGVKSFNVSQDNPVCCSIDGVLYNREQTILIQYPGNKQGKFIIPNSVLSVKSWAFAGCSGLTAISIPNGLTRIGASLFQNCNSLTEVVIPSSVTSLGEQAFCGSRALRQVTIGSGVTTIEARAFMYCTGLMSIVCEATVPPECGENALYMVDKSIPLYVPASSIDAYRSADQWSDFTNILPIEDATPLNPDDPSNPGNYRLTLNASIDGAGVLTGAGLYVERTEVNISAVANDGYTFVEWSDGVTDASRTITMIARDTTLTAVFSINSYTITFVDEDGTTVLASDEYTYGQMPVAPSDPTKADSELYSYTFAGWTPDIVAVTADATYTASYDATYLGAETVTVSDAKNASALPIGPRTNIIVTPTGHLTIDAPLTAKSLALQYGTGTHAQVTGIANLSAESIELALTITASRAWQAFAVPFEVSVASGIRIDGTADAARYNYDFVIEEYDGNLRATSQQGWNRVAADATLQPGRFYMLYTASATDWILTAADPASLSEASEVTVSAYPSLVAAHHSGWNGVANTLFRQAQPSLEGVQYLTTYNNALGVYEVQPMSLATLAAGQPFFVQVPQAGSVLFSQAAGAPARYEQVEDGQLLNCVLSLSAANYTDRAYLSANAAKANVYTLGHDLLKLPSSNASVPQLWFDGYNMHLAAYELPMTGTTAVVPIGLYAPADGSYTLALTDVPSDMTVFLTKNGQPVWTISDSPVLVPLAQGTNAGYALSVRRIPEVATGSDAVEPSDTLGVYKFIRNNQLYILRDGRIYSAQGQVVILP